MNFSNSEVQEVGTGKRDFTQYHLTFAQCCLLNSSCRRERLLDPKSVKSKRHFRFDLTSAYSTISQKS